MKDTMKKDKTGKVINLHYTEVCNYRCRFCYAHFGCTPLTFEDWKVIIDNISRETKVKRFNLAGGEPLATAYVQQMIDYIHSIGIDCSIITNGSLLTPEFIQRNAGKLSMIGISMDAFSHEDNVKLGRVNAAGQTLSPERLERLANEIHQAGMLFKMNTVVNAVNCGKDFNPMVKVLQPDRWKLLRMIHIDGVNDSGDNLLVTDEQFQDFVKRHESNHPVVEDTSDIVSAYIVVNPKGELVDDSRGKYRTSRSLRDHSLREEFKKIAFNEEAYWKRY